MPLTEAELAGERPPGKPVGWMLDLSDIVPFGPGANCTRNICPIEMSVYKYRPDLTVNIIFAVAFSLALQGHIMVGWRWKVWWFLALMIVGCLFEMIGYAGRLMMWDNPFSYPAWMLQTFFMTTGPAFFTAGLYMTFGKA